MPDSHRVGLALSVFAALAAACRPAAALDTRRPDVAAFIAAVAARDYLDADRLRSVLAAAQSQPTIIAAMERPAEKTMPWYRYRPVFVNEQRIQEGVDFWLAHRADLEASAARTGVPARYLVAILGVETYYGRLTGKYRVLDALATLAFDYPPRAAYFRGELEQFLLLCQEQHVDPLTTTGSYAGAMGAPQFMPSAYRRFGLDATEDGRVDLWSNWPDVFDSVGYFLKEHGWTTGAPVLREARTVTPRAGDPAQTDLPPGTTVAALEAQGIVILGPPTADQAAWLIEADTPTGPAWRVGFGNFYAITRYNHSPLYAMAVHDLAAELKARVAAAESRAPAPIEAATSPTAASRKPHPNGRGP
ncbi:MAG: lytic murein transglycosylase B [Gammaproteobacteria bacterium]|nr:lytic murein transglycosylase B [Gammaproteobacteria bacterium]